MASKRRQRHEDTKQTPASSGVARAIQIGAIAGIVVLLGYLVISGMDGAGSPAGTNSAQAPRGDQTVAGGESSPAPSSQPAAPVRINPSTIDFGELEKNVNVTTSVQITNTGSVRLRLVDARPSCPCTTFERSWSAIEPGLTVPLTVHMDSQGREGRKTVSVNLLFSGYELVNIPITAMVLPD